MSLSEIKKEERLAEAARYALLRRLAPAIRHNMAGALQPVGMIAAMLERRLQKPDPDFAALAKNSSDIGELSREAAATCISLMAWVAPKDNDPVALASGVEDCVGLLATELSFGGFNLINQVGTAPAKLARSTLRSVFMASLLALTDATQGPGDVVLSAVEISGGEVLLIMQLIPSAADKPLNPSHAYRKMEWADVKALAEFEGVAFLQEGNRVELRCRISDQG